VFIITTKRGEKEIRRSRKIVIIPHCILNLNAKVRGLANFPEIAKELVVFLLDQNVGIIQMPCPEFTLLGEARWGQCVQQYNTPYFRRHCREIAQQIVDQVEEYLANDYQVCGIIGIDGSPSCGVGLTCEGEWGGELSTNLNLQNQLATLRMVEDSGVLVKELQKALAERNIQLPFLGFPEDADLNQEEKQSFFQSLENFIQGRRK